MPLRMYNTNNGSGTFNVFNTERVLNQAPPKAEQRATEDLIPADKVIAVMGPTGVGKSTFINAAAGFTRVVVGDTLESCSAEIQAVEIDYEQQKVVLVDTPGFDDTYMTDTNVLCIIANWLTATYRNKINLTGIIYMHRITDNRMSGAPLKNLKLFAKLCGTAAAEGVVMTTTMWDGVEPDVGKGREHELRTEYWKGILNQKAQMERFDLREGRKAAWNIIRQLCQRPASKSLLLQEEMVTLGRQLCETAAGQELYGELLRVSGERRKVIEQLSKRLKKDDDVDLKRSLKAERNKQDTELEELMKQLGSLKLSLSGRIRRMMCFSRTQSNPIPV